jgi:uncharacterized protein (DUF1810 family)
MAREYGLTDRTEAAAYRAHPALGRRLLECVTGMLGHGHLCADAVLGQVDAIRACAYIQLTW